MNSLIQDIETQQMKPNFPAFRPGDTISVLVEVSEGNRTRVQAFEGVVIAKRNRGFNSSFTVRKISHGEGVERVFQTHSPVIKGVEVKRKGQVRKAKLYYLRGRTGKSARIRERLEQKSDVRDENENVIQNIDQNTDHNIEIENDNANQNTDHKTEGEEK